MDLLEIESIVKTQLSIRMPELLNNAYPSITFCTEISDKQPIFPNVYIHEIGTNEVGNSIPNNIIHAARVTIQIDVTTNTSKDDCIRVKNACVLAMKALQFSADTVGPVKESNMHRCIIRAARVIANGDEFN